MASILEYLHLSPGSRQIMQGNAAFALGVLHAGYHAAEGYPGTPSTEVMENLQDLPESIQAQWSVNEAVAVGVAYGHSIAGHNAVVTMKVPGLFQAADVVASCSASHAISGALVLFVATDHAPSSSQYLVDSRPFLASLHIPVLEPRNHQDLYDLPEKAAELSRKHCTPVAILCSSALCHSEGMIRIGTCKTPVTFPPQKPRGQVLLPRDALHAFQHSVLRKIPAVLEWSLHQNLSEILDSATDPNFPTTETEIPGEGPENFGIIATGEACLIVEEALHILAIKPMLLKLGMIHPLPLPTIQRFFERIRGHVYLFEDGERFVEEKLNHLGYFPRGKREHPTITHWDPDSIMDILAQREHLAKAPYTPHQEATPLQRPPAICPGCPYKAVSFALQSLKQRGRIKYVFGDIGCSTLLHFQNALDFNLCMGASESMRQGYVLSHPGQAGHVLSMIGDSSECHSGLDATRNAIFRKIPGVKIILDNRAIAMTGAQSTPSSTMDLVHVLKSEGMMAKRVDAYDANAIECALREACENAELGMLSAIVIDGTCIEVADRRAKKNTSLQVIEDQCTQCGACMICPGMSENAEGFPVIGELCTRCGEGAELCASRCPTQAIQIQQTAPRLQSQPLPWIRQRTEPDFATTEEPYPSALRIGICGVGGQGNLFFGKVLARVMQSTPYATQSILKGDVHGMAQKGGAVWSTFACGVVHSPMFASGSMDYLVGMERSEILRPEYQKLLKPTGTILVNDSCILPLGTTAAQYPTLEAVVAHHQAFQTFILDASGQFPRNANAAMLGALSQLSPLRNIPSSIWIQAFEELSPHGNIAQSNVLAFEYGVQSMQAYFAQAKHG